MSDKLELGFAALKRAWDEFERTAPTLSDKHRALELAGIWEMGGPADTPPLHGATASELRRLVGQVRELREALLTADRTFAENGLLACHAARQEISAALTNTKD